MRLSFDETQHSRAIDLCLLAGVAGLLFFLSLGERDLWNPNEPTYGKAVAEMEQRGDWLIPTVNDQVFAEKPILYYWCALASAKLLGGVDEFSLRLPAALAGILSVWLTYLLILPYVGRRRALLSAALLMTMYQVFWASRSVQMDILVLASTLGVVVPITRFLDFGWRPTPAFILAGCAAGLGFSAKGPVTWVIPGLIILAYCVQTRRLHMLFHRSMWIGALVTLAVSAPWYVMLWLQGEAAILQEVLLRQNVSRFLEAWDHQQPWWYFLKYLWLDYAPWALFLPAAFFIRAKFRDENRLHILAWIWLVMVLLFFSLSDSKRAPYILPVAPAVAALVGGVIDRWIGGELQEKVPRALSYLALVALAMLFFAAGVVVMGSPLESLEALIPEALLLTARSLGLLCIIIGLGTACGIVFLRRRPAFAPLFFLGGFGAFYLFAATLALPAGNHFKSARTFASEMNLGLGDAPLASFQFWRWRSGIAYYADRSIPNLESPNELQEYWRDHEDARILVERRDEEELRALLPAARLVQEGAIGSRQNLLFARAAGAVPAGVKTARSLIHPATTLLEKLTDPGYLSSPRMMGAKEIPIEIVSTLIAGRDSADIRIEHHRILAYEIESEPAEGFETELFVDRFGNCLTTVIKPVGEDLEEAEDLDQIPRDARRSIEAILGQTPLLRLQREIEWGISVYAAKWQGPRGAQELKVLDDGRLLFIELPRDEPIPEPVRELAAGSEVEALLLDVYIARDPSRTANERMVLSAGLLLASVPL